MLQPSPACVPSCPFKMPSATHSYTRVFHAGCCVCTCPHAGCVQPLSAQPIITQQTPQAIFCDKESETAKDLTTACVLVRGAGDRGALLLEVADGRLPQAALPKCPPPPPPPPGPLYWKPKLAAAPSQPAESAFSLLSDASCFVSEWQETTTSTALNAQQKRNLAFCQARASFRRPFSICSSSCRGKRESAFR